MPGDVQGDVMGSRWRVRRGVRDPLPTGVSDAGRWGRATVRTLAAAVVVPALLLVGCDTDDGLAPEPLEEAAPEGETDPLPEAAEAAEDTEDTAASGEPGLAIAPGTALGPGEVTTVVGGLTVTFDLPTEVEGGTVAPGGVPPALEILSDGGAVVVFEALGHAQADGTDGYSVTAGFPEDLAAWLTDDLPGEVRPAEAPAELDDGVAAVLQSDETERTWPIVLWEFDDDAAPGDLEGHGPPPGQTQSLWLRELDDGWVGVVTYGLEVDLDLAETIALSLQGASG